MEYVSQLVPAAQLRHDLFQFTVAICMDCVVFAVGGISRIVHWTVLGHVSQLLALVCGAGRRSSLRSSHRLFLLFWRFLRRLSCKNFGRIVINRIFGVVLHLGRTIRGGSDTKKHRGNYIHHREVVLTMYNSGADMIRSIINIIPLYPSVVNFKSSSYKHFSTIDV